MVVNILLRTARLAVAFVAVEEARAAYPKLKDKAKRIWKIIKE